MRYVVLPLLLVLAAACGTRATVEADAGQAAKACEQSALPLISSYAASVALSGAFLRPASVVAQWEETMNLPDGPHVVRSRWRDYPADSLVALCYYDASFDNYSLPGPPGHRTSGFERAFVLVGPAGAAVLDHIGTKRTTPIVAP